MVEPKISDKITDAFARAWLPGHLPGADDLTDRHRAALAAVYPLIEAEVRERLAQSVDRLYATEAPGCACPAVGVAVVKMYEREEATGGYASSLRADLDRAEAALKAVREIHALDGVGGSEPYCPECGGKPWPCPTISAINDAFTVVSPPHVREWLAATHGDASGQRVVEDDPRAILRRLDEMRARLLAQIDARYACRDEP